jgi:hypothetical protein
MDATMENLRQQLEEEKTARQKEVETLTARIEKLEINATAAGGHPERFASGVASGGSGDDEHVVVIGGFGVKPKPQAVKLITDIMRDVGGVGEVFATQPLPKVVFARFRTTEDMGRFLRTQKQHKGFCDAKLWASKNRTPEERRRGRALGAIKRKLIEVGGFSADNVILDWRKSAAHVVQGDEAPKVAEVKADGEIEWVQGSGVDIAATKAAVATELESQ